MMEVIAWRRRFFWIAEADKSAVLPRGWHWGEPWHERGEQGQRHIRGRWAVRNRDGRQVRVAFQRYAGARVRPTSLDLILNVEDLARTHPDRLDEVTRSIHSEMLANLGRVSAHMVSDAVDEQLERLNARARDVLDGHSDAGEAGTHS